MSGGTVLYGFIYISTSVFVHTMRLLVTAHSYCHVGSVYSLWGREWSCRDSFD